MKYFLGLVLLISSIAGEQVSEPVGILTSVNGDINIIRAQGTLPIQANLLDFLFKGDTLVVDNLGSVTIFYKSGGLQIIKANIRQVINLEADTSDSPIKQPVNKKEMSVLYDELCVLKQVYTELAIDNDTDTEDTIKFLIQYPGNTALLNPRPDIIWNKFPGANWYTMRIQRGSEILSNIATTDTVFLYPENEEDMLPGNYKIKVLAVHNSDTLSKITRSLTILDSLSVHNIRGIIKRIAQQKPDDFTFHLLKATFYRKKLLRLMAIESFEELLTLTPGSPILYRGLAEIYESLGMSDLGHAFYNLSKQTISTPEIQEP